MTRVMFHFPDGCGGLVDMRLEKDLRSFYPLRGFIALDDATPVYQNLRVPYYAHEPLTLTLSNRGEVERTVSCTVSIRYGRPWWF